MSFKSRSSAAQISSLLLLLVASFKAATPQGDAGQTPQSHGVVLADMDRSLQPGEDFYRYSNGNWLRTNVIPPDRASVSVFSQLAELSDHRVSGMIDSIAKSSDAATAATRKIADLYHSYMDEAAVEARGLAPLKAGTLTITPRIFCRAESRCPTANIICRTTNKCRLRVNITAPTSAPC